MSFCQSKEIVSIGDTVILYLSPSCLHAIRVVQSIKNKHGETVENVFQTTYGALKVSSLIGLKYGSKVDLTRGWAFVLLPTPELWTLTLPHRTQIIYTPDISMIIYQLEIKPRSHVVESGTGSGSLTHALVRRVQPDGFVTSFDFHEQRVLLAREEFEDHGLSMFVNVVHRDVCNDGFGPEVEGKADSIFLDLPHPWLVVPHAFKALKRTGGRFCSFSPCIEQVQKTCAALQDIGFIEINTLECLQREISVCKRTLPVISFEKDNSGSSEENKHTFTAGSYQTTMPGHTGYLTFATLPPSWIKSVLVPS